MLETGATTLKLSVKPVCFTLFFQVFCLQVNNGIPINSWFGDPLDEALVQLLPFLENLVDAEDVRPIIAKKFCNSE